MNYRKNYVLVAPLILALVVVAGCGDSGDNPTATVKKFFTAVEKGDSKTLERIRN